MARVIYKVLLAAALLAMCEFALSATVTARLDRGSAVVGETVTLILQTNDTNQSLDTDLSALQVDFDVLDRRSETQMSFVNGKQTAMVRLVVTLEPKRAGNLLIPALNFPGARSSPLQLKVSAAPEVAPGEPEPVFIEVQVQPEAGPYFVHSQISLTVRIFYQANLTEAAINPPAPELASVRLLDEVPFQADRNGVQYRVLERRYAIFPERSGTLVIPPMQLTGRLIERPSDRLWQPTVRGRRVRIESEPLNLAVKPRPAAFTGQHWLPARRITLSQKISDGDNLRVGEPVTRTIIVDAVGLEENMLEEPPWPDMPDTRVYPDQPQGISRDDGEWVLGHKEFRYAIVPEAEGVLVLPEIRLDWWDTVANRQHTAILPEHRVTVLPSELGLDPVADRVAAAPGILPQAINQLSGKRDTASANVMPWRVATAAFALLWLTTLLWFVYRQRRLVVVPESRDVLTIDEKNLLKRFKRACSDSDPVAARGLMSQWVRNFAPERMRGSMREFATASQHASLQAAIAVLDGAGFTQDVSPGWNGRELWQAFREWQRGGDAPANGDVAGEPVLYG